MARSGGGPKEPQDWWKGRTVDDSLRLESSPSTLLMAISWEVGGVLLLYVTASRIPPLLEATWLLLVAELCTLSALLLLLGARQGEENVRAGAWAGGRLLDGLGMRLVG